MLSAEKLIQSDRHLGDIFDDHYGIFILILHKTFEPLKCFFFFFPSQNRFRDVLGKLTTPIDGPFNFLIVLFACCHFVWIRGSNALVMFVCVEVLRSSQPNGVMSSAVSLPNHTFTGKA